MTKLLKYIETNDSKYLDAFVESVIPEQSKNYISVKIIGVLYQISHNATQLNKVFKNILTAIYNYQERYYIKYTDYIISRVIMNFSNFKMSKSYKKFLDLDRCKSLGTTYYSLKYLDYCPNLSEVEWYNSYNYNEQPMLFTAIDSVSTDFILTLLKYSNYPAIVSGVRVNLKRCIDNHTSLKYDLTKPQYIKYIVAHEQSVHILMFNHLVTKKHEIILEFIDKFKLYSLLQIKLSNKYVKYSQFKQLQIIPNRIKYH